MVMIKSIVAEVGEECRVDIDNLHETLKQLPADMYIDLFRKMQEKIYGYPAYQANCSCSGTCGEQEEKDE